MILRKISKEILAQTWFFIIILILASFLLRIWHLGAIKEKIFDEVYFVTFAKNYLSHTNFFDIHPPLGKLIIALGIKIFSDNEIGARIMPAIFGTALIGLGYLTGKELAGKMVGIFTALILSFDGMILVYSRIGLIDIFLVFFILLSFYGFLKFANSKKTIFLILTGVSLGLAASVKYIGALVILTFILIAIVKKIPLIKNLWRLILFIVFLPTLIYLAFFLFNFSPNSQFFREVINWHQQSFNYNLHLSEGHPYASKWWGWFLLLRPIWLYFKDVDSKYIGVVGMGNPLAWWSSIVVVPLLVWGVSRKKNAANAAKTNIIILASFLIFWLFWAFFSRVLFMYHAIPSFIFLSLGIAFWLEKLLKEKFGKTFVAAYFVILIILFIFFLPIWLGLPIDPAAFYHRTWLKGWI